MSRLASQRSQHGFALVEALASLAVVGMICLMLVAGATTGRRVWEGIDTREAAGEVIESAQANLRDRLEQAYPVISYEANPPVIDFRGSGETISFLSSPPDVGRPAPLRRYTLYLDAAGKLALASVTDAAAPEAPADQSQVLLSGVRAIDIAYFGVFRGELGPRWGRMWRDQPVLPSLVRVRLAFEPGDTRQWPDLIIRPRTTIDTSCQIDLSSHHCKGRQ